MMRTEIKKLKDLFICDDKDAKYIAAKDILGTREDGTYNSYDGELLYWAWKLVSSVSKEMEQDLMFERFYKHNEERYEKYIVPFMKKINPAEFYMGSDSRSRLKYCGECPKHKVNLLPFFVGITSVTQQMYKQYDKSYLVDTEANMPATNLNWYDATMYSKWVGCRLLTEAEWEYACKSDSLELWCCPEEDLDKYAWYSENSDGVIHPVQQTKPNQFGIFDMHGNVWEWCADSYDENYYLTSPGESPLNNQDKNEKVCRGGSIHAFVDMCRASFRYYENAEFKAYDLGFRLAKSINK